VDRDNDQLITSCGSDPRPLILAPRDVPGPLFVIGLQDKTLNFRGGACVRITTNHCDFLDNRCIAVGAGKLSGTLCVHPRPGSRSGDRRACCLYVKSPYNVTLRLKEGIVIIHAEDAVFPHIMRRKLVAKVMTEFLHMRNKRV